MAAKKSTSKKPPKKSKNGAPSLADLKKREAEGRKLIAKLQALFPEAQELPEGDRARSQGRLGGDESKAMVGVVDAMDAEPALFNSLADEDQGHDPDKLETDLLRDRLERHGIYAALGDDLAKVGRAFSDQALTVGALVAPVVRAAYEIAKPVSKRNEVIRKKIAPMLNYHGANAAAAVASRKANKAKKGAEVG